jgi:hypothetical protein
MRLLTWNEVLKSNLNKGQLAERCRLKTYDVALPQQWLDTMSDRLSKSPTACLTRDQAYDKLLFGTVWNYQKGDLFGSPFYLYQELKEVMENESPCSV